MYFNKFKFLDVLEKVALEPKSNILTRNYFLRDPSAWNGEFQIPKHNRNYIAIN
jgi:hypothetical protein